MNYLDDLDLFKSSLENHISIDMYEYDSNNNKFTPLVLKFDNNTFSYSFFYHFEIYKNLSFETFDLLFNFLQSNRNTFIFLGEYDDFYEIITTLFVTPIFNRIKNKETVYFFVLDGKNNQHNYFKIEPSFENNDAYMMWGESYNHDFNNEKEVIDFLKNSFKNIRLATDSEINIAKGHYCL